MEGSVYLWWLVCAVLLFCVVVFVFSPGVIEWQKDENATRKDENKHTKQKKTTHEIAERPNIASHTK